MGEQIEGDQQDKGSSQDPEALREDKNPPYLEWLIS
jgi:hypothetical protein